MGVIDDLIAKLQGGLYYDKGLAAAANAAQRKAADLQSQYGVGKQNVLGQYDSDQFSINKALDKALVDMGGNYGSKGTLHSSVYVDDQGRTNNAAQEQLSQAALRRSQALSGLETGLQSGQTDILNMLGGAESDAAGRFAAARHQAEQERAQADYNRQMLDFQRQQQAAQTDYYNRSLQQGQQASAAQQAQYNALAAAMKPVTYPTGQSAYPNWGEVLPNPAHGPGDGFFPQRDTSGGSYQAPTTQGPVKGVGGGFFGGAGYSDGGQSQKPSYGTIDNLTSPGGGSFSPQAYRPGYGN